MNFINKRIQDDEHDLLLTIENDEITDRQNITSKNINKSTIPKNKKEFVQIKNCDKISDNNFSIIENIYGLINKKLTIVFIIVLLFVFYINSTGIPWNITEMVHANLPVTRVNNVSTTEELTIVVTIPTSPTNIRTSTNFNSSINLYGTTTQPPIPSGFRVWSDQCKIPNIDPYDREIMKHFKRQKYETCSTKEPLTNIRFDSTTKFYTLNLKEDYNSSLDCCYQDIIRNEKGKNADKKITLGKCFNFNKSVEISNSIDNILVKCKSKKKQVYIHGHPMMPERAEIRDRLDSWKKNDTKRPPSILMIGIDSISRNNLFRAMPETTQKLHDNNWFEMSGYNKMGDNTFPNLMAILTGFNSTTAYVVCDPKRVAKLDNCPIIWKLFQKHGYVTAYSEDEVSISTFNYLKLGFEEPPVDYYLRPFMIAAEKNLPIRKKDGLTFCLGYQHSADYVFNYAIELATRYKNDPYFGLFWANTFSHNGISDCSSMDLKIAEYLEELSSRGILNESVVIFFSDHGMRFGAARKTISGYFEERLPFMFIWLPQWLKTTYPEFVNSLRINKNRLTNPYDIHMTLKNLLELSGRTSTKLPKAADCPNCQSLLKPVSYNRSCQDIAISDHWCTCVSYQSIDIKSDIVHKLALYVVGYINNYVQNFKNGSIASFCEIIQLHNINGAYRVNFTDDNYPKKVEGYRLVLTTIPGNGLFEATLRRKPDTEEFQITGTISRLNLYAADSICISDSIPKKYCHCANNATTIKYVATTTTKFVPS